MHTYQVYRNGRLTARQVAPATAPLWPGTSWNDGLLELTAGVPLTLPVDDEEPGALPEAAAEQ